MKNYIGVKIVKAESKERNMAPKAAPPPGTAIRGEGLPCWIAWGKEGKCPIIRPEPLIICRDPPIN